MIHLSFIRSFVTVAQIGSFKATADKLFITQPAVSQHIQALEKNVGAKLFERQGKKVFLTDSGKIFLSYAENILNQYQEAKIQAKEAINQFNGTIRIATTYSIGLYKLQPIVRKFLKKYPQMDIHLEYHPNSLIYEMVLNHSVDFGLVAYPQKRKDIRAEIFAREDMALIQSSQRPIIKESPIPLSSLNQTKFITLNSNTPTQEAIDHFLKLNEVTIQIVHAYDNIETLKSAVLLGMGCAIVPKNTVTRELKEGALECVQVDQLKSFKRDLGIISPTRKIFTKATKMFYKTITESQSSLPSDTADIY
ncbi:MAG: LysR family transcriptional regulator [Candidatus Omnitrophota bacterium]